jgi:predicted ATPase
MLTEIQIRNFKCFRDTGKLELRPLTFLVGPNSSGKSSLAQVLLMMRQTTDDLVNPEIPILPNNGFVKLGTFQEFIHRNDTTLDLEIHVGFRTRRFHSPLEPNPKFRDFSFHAVFSFDESERQIFLKHKELWTDDENIRIETNRKQSKLVTQATYISRDKSVLQYDPGPYIRFYAFPPPPPVIDEGVRGKRRTRLRRATIYPGVLYFGSRLVQEHLRRVYYIGPLRDFPQRVYTASGLAYQDVGIRGEHFVDLLKLSKDSASERPKTLLTHARKWLQLFNFGSDIKVSYEGVGNYYRVMIQDPYLKLQTNIADVGFGTSQTLPIIAECFLAPPESTIIVEQPEIHLHPKGQSILGDLFIDAAQSGERTLIVETHSESILARIRRRIAEGQLPPDQIVVYYFEPTANGTEIHRVDINTRGQYEGFPTGFFEEDVFEAFEHLRALSKSPGEGG